MLTVVVAVACQPTSAGQADTLRGISEAFSSALDRNASRGVGGILTVLAVALAFAIVRWVRREARRRRGEPPALDEAREAIASKPPPRPEHREWVRVPGHLRMTVLRTGANPRAHFDVFETQNLGGGGLAFLSHAPPARGTPLAFTLDLGERRSLAMRGVVVRVDPPPTPDSPSLVVLKFGEVDNATREHLMKWIAAEEVREIAEARRGHLCSRCSRPLADGAAEMHSTCAAQVGG